MNLKFLNKRESGGLWITCKRNSLYIDSIKQINVLYKIYIGLGVKTTA